MRLKVQSRQTIGVLLVLLVVALWVASSELTQSIFKNNSFNRAFFLTYFTASFFNIYLIYYAPIIYDYFRAWVMPAPANSSASEIGAIYGGTSSDSLSGGDKSSEAQCANPILDATQETQNSSSSRSQESSLSEELLLGKQALDAAPPCAELTLMGRWRQSVLQSMHGKLTFEQTAKLAAELTMVWFAMNYTFNLSLEGTSVSSNTIISSMSGPFSLAFSWLLLGSRLSLLNVSGVLATVAGTALTALLDRSGDDGKSTFVGDLLALVSATIYGFYVALMKRRLTDENSVSMYLLFGCIGACISLSLWPVFFLLHYARLETVSVPPAGVALLLSLNAVLSVASDYFWAQSILLTSPVVASVGCALMIPLAMLADAVFRRSKYSGLYWLAAAIVTAGFLLVNLDLKNETDRQKEAAVKGSASNAAIAVGVPEESDSDVVLQ